MRLTSEMLQKFAEDFVRRRCEEDHSIVAAFLSGSLVDDNPLWCAVPDVDVFFIHNRPPEKGHEVVPLVGDAHFDVYHHDQGLYEPGRTLRTDALLGPLVFGARALYDPRHFFDFVQAGVRAQFDRPEYAWMRAEPRLEAARNTWFALASMEFSAAFLVRYVQALQAAAEGVALLAGRSLTLRRFGWQLRDALQTLGAEALLQGFLGLSGALEVTPAQLRDTLPAWEAAWRACQGSQWDTVRLGYVRAGVQVFLEGAEAPLGWWPVLISWSEAADESPQAAESLLQVGRALGLSDAEERRTALDAFLDALADVVDSWRRENGLM